MADWLKIQNIITKCATAVDSGVSRFVVSLMIMDELKAAGLENSPENNKLIQEKLDRVTGIKGLPKIGDEVDIPTSTYDVPGVVEEIDYNYEVVCGIDDFGEPFNIPFDDF